MFVAIAVASSSTFVGLGTQVIAQEVSPTAAEVDNTGQVSDWAQAGLLWSQAHYARKLASSLKAKQPGDGVDRVIDRYDSLIGQLEGFGWKRVAREARALPESGETAAPAAMPATNAAIPDAAKSDAAIPDAANPDAAARVAAKTDPKSVGDALANELGVQPSTPGATTDPDSGVRTLDPTPTRPAMPVVASDVAIARSRVDEIVDQKVAEEAAVRAGIASGVTGAIAAGIDNVDPNVSVPTNDREAQTRSDSMAFSNDSIYGLDGTDGDRGVGASRAPDRPTQADDTLAQIAPAGRALTRDKPAPARVPAPRDRRGGMLASLQPMAMMDSDAVGQKRDADWLELTLANYQNRWDALARAETITPETLRAHLQAAELELEATAKNVAAGADSQKLRDLATKILTTR